jgi:DNA-binding NtrC family response regulator
MAAPVNLKEIEVLLFDNRFEQSIMLEEMLEQLGCRTNLVMDELGCFAKLLNSRYDLVIFDHSTPGLDVNGFVNQLETIDRSMSVAMLVTLPSAFYEEKYGCSGIDFLLFKPFGLEGLLILVEDAFKYSQKLKNIS